MLQVVGSLVLTWVVCSVWADCSDCDVWVTWEGCSDWEVWGDWADCRTWANCSDWAI